MRKVLFIGIPLLVLALMEGAVWLVLKSSSEEEASVVEQPEQQMEVAQKAPEPEEPLRQDEPQQENNFSPANPATDVPLQSGTNYDPDNFPPPTTEVKNGITERTIHMGVRQWAWDPATITAKKGELVRLIIHNADVKHGIAIPDLGVMEGDILSEGAIIEFTASKAGTFEFFCSVWCGERHIEMQGKIIIEG